MRSKNQAGGWYLKKERIENGGDRVGLIPKLVFTRILDFTTNQKFLLLQV